VSLGIRIGAVAGFCKHGDEPWGFDKGREISWLGERLLTFQEGLYSA